MSYHVDPVRSRYRNHRGEVSTRHVLPTGWTYGPTPWHPTAGLVLHGVDLDKGEVRSFGVKDVIEWIGRDD